jgi:hypothetical protein
MKVYFSLFLIFSLSASALETDNYLVWDKELPDVSTELNSLIINEVEDVLLKSAKDSLHLSCEDITFKIADRFKTTPTKKLFENWTNAHLSQKMYPSGPYYLEESILKKSPRTYLKYSGLSPNVMVNGVYFGVDKLSHFGSTGRRYLKKYLDSKKSGLSDEEAVHKAIFLGLQNEQTVLGIWASGVYSYADVEANYQGLLFYKNFCLNKKDTFLDLNNGKWHLVRQPDLRNYVNPLWDETFNFSYFTPKTWSESSKIILSAYCPLVASPLRMMRLNHYQTIFSDSTSSLLVKKLQASSDKLTPIPQSFELLCLTGENI